MKYLIPDLPRLLKILRTITDSSEIYHHYSNERIINEQNEKQNTDVEFNVDDDEANIYMKQLTKHEEAFVREYFSDKKITIGSILKTNVSGYVLILFPDGSEKMYDIDGFYPVEVSRSK